MNQTQTRLRVVAQKPAGQPETAVLAPDSSERGITVNSNTAVLASETPDPFGMINVFDTLPTKTSGSSGKVYPVLSTPEAIELAGCYTLNKQQFDALEGAMKVGRSNLAKMAWPMYVEHCKGLSDPPSSVIIMGKVKNGEEMVETGEVKVIFPDKFDAVAPDKRQEVLAIIGDTKLAGELFENQFEIVVDGTELPKGEKTNTLLKEMRELFAKHNALNALKFDQVIKPKKGFSKVRHTKLTVEQNLRLNTVMRCQAMVKTVGNETNQKEA